MLDWANRVFDPKVQRFTKIFIWVAMTIIIATDVVLAFNGYYNDTISEITVAYSYRWITIGTLHGILTGHLFWPTFKPILFKWRKLLVCVGWVAVWVLVDIRDYFDVLPIIPVLVNIPIGRLLWPQKLPKGTKLLNWKG